MSERHSFILQDSGYSWVQANSSTKRLYKVVEGSVLPPDALVHVEFHERPPMGRPVRADLHTTVQAVCAAPLSGLGLVVMPVFILTNPDW